MTEAAAIKFLAIGIDDSENKNIDGKNYQKIRVIIDAFVDEEFDKMYFYITPIRFSTPITSMYESEKDALESMKEKFGDLFDMTDPEDMFYYKEIEEKSELLKSLGY